MFNTQETNQESQEQVQETSHVLDQPTVLQGEEDMPLFYEEPETIVPAQNQNQNVDNGKGGEEEEEDKSKKPNAFEEEEQKALDQKGTEEDAVLIEKLKSLGYDVSKKEVPNEDQVFNDKMKIYENSIEQSEQFIALDDDRIVQEKVKFDLMSKYRSTGREHLINSQEFEIEAEAEFDTYDSNDALKKIYADNIRRDIKEGVLAKTTNAKQQLIEEQSKKIDQKINESKANLRNSFNEIFAQGLLGMKFEKEEIQNAFDYISSGKFSKEIKDDPNSLAELALYRLNRDKIVSKIGGPTYGEGVRDAIKELEGGKKDTSHISNAMQKSAGKSQSNSVRDWSSFLDENSDEIKDKKII